MENLYNISDVTWYYMQPDIDKVHNLLQSVNLQKTLHSSPSQVSYGVSVVNILEKNEHVMRVSCASTAKDCHITGDILLYYWGKKYKYINASLKCCNIGLLIYECQWLPFLRVKHLKFAIHCHLSWHSCKMWKVRYGAHWDRACTSYKPSVIYLCTCRA